MRDLLCLLLVSVAALAQPPAEPGLYIANLEKGGTWEIGAYHNPSPDPVNHWLYADDGNGTVVRWKDDALNATPQVFAKTKEGEPPLAAPIVAPTGGMVVLSRVWPVKQGAQVLYRRVAIEVYDSAGKRLAGPLPLCRTEQVYHRQAIAVWHPDGTKLAFTLTEGNSRPGLYVFLPKTKNWVLAEDYADGAPDPLPILRWQPNGRSLTLIQNEELVMRGGGKYAAYRRLPASTRLHFWLNPELFAYCDPAEGLLLRGLQGEVEGTVAGWQGRAWDEPSLPVVSEHGTVWVAPQRDAPAELQLWHLPKGQQTAKAILSFAKAPNQAYGRTSGIPAWLPNRASVAFEVPATQ